MRQRLYGSAAQLFRRNIGDNDRQQALRDCHLQSPKCHSAGGVPCRIGTDENDVCSNQLDYRRLEGIRHPVVWPQFQQVT
jgi:hypothetical protein